MNELHGLCGLFDWSVSNGMTGLFGLDANGALAELVVAIDCQVSGC